MTNLIVEDPVLAAVLTLIAGICILGLSGLHAENDETPGYAISMRTACAGLLVICLSGIQFGVIMLREDGMFLLGVLALMLAIPSGLVFAFAAATSFRPSDIRPSRIDMKSRGPWG